MAEPETTVTGCETRGKVIDHLRRRLESVPTDLGHRNISMQLDPMSSSYGSVAITYWGPPMAEAAFMQKLQASPLIATTRLGRIDFNKLTDAVNWVNALDKDRRAQIDMQGIQGWVEGRLW